MEHATTEPDACSGRPPQHVFRRVLHLRKPRLLHLEDADLVRGAETVLHRPQDPVGSVAVALEIQDSVHHMLQHPRAGDRSPLSSHVPR